MDRNAPRDPFRTNTNFQSDAGYRSASGNRPPIPGDPFAPRPAPPQRGDPFAPRSNITTPAPRDPFASRSSTDPFAQPNQSGFGSSGFGQPSNFGTRPPANTGFSGGSGHAGGFAGSTGDPFRAGSSFGRPTTQGDPFAPAASNQPNSFQQSNTRDPFQSTGYQSSFNPPPSEDPFAPRSNWNRGNARSANDGPYQSYAQSAPTPQDPFARNAPRRNGGPQGDRPRVLSTQILIKGVPLPLFSREALFDHFEQFPDVNPVSVSLRGSTDPDGRRTALVSFSTPQETSVAMSRARYHQGNPLVMSYYRPSERTPTQNMETQRATYVAAPDVQESNELLFSYVPPDLFSEEAVRHLFNSISGNKVVYASVRSRRYRGTVKRTAIIEFEDVEGAKAALENLPLYKGQVLQVSYRSRPPHLQKKHTNTNAPTASSTDAMSLTNISEGSAMQEDLPLGNLSQRQYPQDFGQEPQPEHDDRDDAVFDDEQPGHGDDIIQEEVEAGLGTRPSRQEEREIEMARLRLKIMEKEKEKARKSEASRLKGKKQTGTRDGRYAEPRINERRTKRSVAEPTEALNRTVREKVDNDGTWRKVGKKVDLQNAVQFVGTCQTMCPAKEFHDRNIQKDIAVFETVDNLGEEADPMKAVKKYRRSAAISEQPAPDEIRPPPVLLKTMNHLKTVCDLKTATFADIHNFVRDRTRSLRQDFTYQGVRDEICIKIHEESVRFHILSEHRLVGTDPAVFSSKQNREQLDKCLISLREMYDIRREQKLPTAPNEPEMQAYYILTQMSKPKTCVQLFTGFAPDVRRSAPVQFALEVVKAASNNFGNYVGYFAFVRAAPYLMACLMHSHFTKIRCNALQVINSAHGNPTGHDTIEVSTLTRQLGFENNEETEQFCTHMGMDVLYKETTGTEASLKVISTPSRGFSVDKAETWTQDRSNSMIEAKVTSLVPSQIISGSTGFKVNFAELPHCSSSYLKAKHKPLLEQEKTPIREVQSPSTVPVGNKNGGDVQNEVEKGSPVREREKVDALPNNVEAGSGAFLPFFKPVDSGAATENTPLVPHVGLGSLPGNEAGTGKLMPTQDATNVVAPKQSLFPFTALPSSSRQLPPTNRSSDEEPSFALPTRIIPAPALPSPNIDNVSAPEQQSEVPGRREARTVAKEVVREGPPSTGKKRSDVTHIQSRRTQPVPIRNVQRARAERQRQEQIILAEAELEQAKSELAAHRTFMQLFRATKNRENYLRHRLQTLEEKFQSLSVETEGPSSVLEDCRAADLVFNAMSKELNSSITEVQMTDPPTTTGKLAKDELLRDLQEVKMLGQKVWRDVWLIRGLAIAAPKDLRRKVLPVGSVTPKKVCLIPGEKRKASVDENLGLSDGRKKKQRELRTGHPTKAQDSEAVEVPSMVRELDVVQDAMRRNGLIRWDCSIVQGPIGQGDDEELLYSWIKTRLTSNPDLSTDVVCNISASADAEPLFVCVRDVQSGSSIPTSSNVVVFSTTLTSRAIYQHSLSILKEQLTALRFKRDSRGAPAPTLIILHPRIRQADLESGNAEVKVCNADLDGFRRQGLIDHFHVVEVSSTCARYGYTTTRVLRSFAQTVTEAMNSMKTRDTDLKRMSVGNLLVHVGNSAWIRCLSGPKQIPEDPHFHQRVIDAVNSTWSNVAKLIAHEEQQWPAEMDEYRERLKRIRILLQRKARLPLPGQINAGGANEYISHLAKTAGVAVPSIGDNSFRAHAQFCRALGHILVPFVSSVLGDEYSTILHLPSKSIRTSSTSTPYDIGRGVSYRSANVLLPPENIERAWDGTPIRVKQKRGLSGQMSSLERSKAIKGELAEEMKFADGNREKARRRSLDLVPRTLDFSPHPKRRRQSLPTDTRKTQEMYRFYDTLVKAEEAHLALIDDTIAILQSHRATAGVS